MNENRFVAGPPGSTKALMKSIWFIEFIVFGSNITWSMSLVKLNFFFPKAFYSLSLSFLVSLKISLHMAQMSINQSKDNDLKYLLNEILLSC